MPVVRLEGAGVVRVYFGGVCGLGVAAWVNGIAGSAREEEGLGAVVVGGHGGLVLISRVEGRW